MDGSTETSVGERPWWLDAHFALLIALVGGIYFTRVTTLSIRGEESRRARVAVEIIESNDWIVPRQQGQIYLSRPPLGSWPIAVLGILRGRVDLLAVRLPTVLATFLTTILIYFYSRTFLSSLGALASAAAFVTMGQVLQIGRLAETEATFTLLVSASLLLWHWGYTRGWPAGCTWSLGYGLAALAGLAKGPQGPLYFAAPVVVYLLFVQRCAYQDGDPQGNTCGWRGLLTRQHALGMLVFAIVLGAWQIPYYLSTDWASVRGIWLNNASQRFADSNPTVFLKHVVSYPWIVLGCMLPWSVLLAGYADRRLWRSLGTIRPHVLFLFTSLAVTFPSVWMATGAKGRYFMPIYPCFAILIGIVIQKAVEEKAHVAWRKGWRLYLAALAGIAVIAGTTVGIASWAAIERLGMLAQPAGFATLYLAVALGLGWVLWRTSRPTAAFSAEIGVLAAVGFLGVTFTGVLINCQVKASEDTASAIAKIKRQLPLGEVLVSFGRIDHLFAYHYGLPIRVVSWPNADSTGGAPAYFCFDQDPQAPKELPFAWQKVGVVSLERNHTDQPRRMVVVGRRLREPEETAGRRTSADRAR